MKFTEKKCNHISPPERSINIFTDFANFLLKKPKVQTKIKFDTPKQRRDYTQRVMQRMGVNVEEYSVFNIHKIGIDAPVIYVFNELLNWNGNSTCWPNHIARVQRKNNSIEEINILPFGWKKYPFGRKNSFLGLHYIPLFYLHSLRVKKTPDAFDFDNARYLLYDCFGGYPIGIFAMYVRSSIPTTGEQEKTQLFFLVSFNFYGKHDRKLGNKLWEKTHDRVTSHVLIRIKQLCEWRLFKIADNHEFL